MPQVLTVSDLFSHWPGVRRRVAGSGIDEPRQGLTVACGNHRRLGRLNAVLVCFLIPSHEEPTGHNALTQSLVGLQLSALLGVALTTAFALHTGRRVWRTDRPSHTVICGRRVRKALNAWLILLHVLKRRHCFAIASIPAAANGRD